MSALSDREETIFARALGMDSPQAREAYLREVCGDDDGLRERLTGLLSAHNRAGRFLEHNAPAPVAQEPDSPLAPQSPPLHVGGDETKTPLSEKPGDRIGRYQLLEQIGEGGMGTVWMAEQEEPVRRRVALKVIKLGMDTRQVLARFEAERQALALMEHPNIARVFDGGATDTARPYFVMELVRGLPITKYCDEAKLSTRQRLELFGQVCRAVQHAHQKGIIHRDLKPSNILVAVQDDRPVVKVIDFGIAKAAGVRLTDKTLFTGFNQLMGTPAYMSPEQAGLGSLDIDTRSDTYSLGVVLYELLTGRPPFDTTELLKQGYEAVLRTIREIEPVKPSTRLKQERVAAGVSRRIEQSAVRNPQAEIEGDLDWIVMKCLEKDRARRYETANSLALDLERYLQDEPVQARPPSTRYRLRKFVRKHRGTVAAAAGFVALLLAATAVSSGLAIWANNERDRAEKAQLAETAQRRAAETERNYATSAEAEARAVLEFFQDKFLAAGRPTGEPNALGRETTILAALNAAEPAIAKSFVGRPRVEAEIRATLGLTYHKLGDDARGIEQLERALALRASDPTLAVTNRLYFMLGLSEMYRALGQHSNALAMLERILPLYEATYGPTSSQTLQAMAQLAIAQLSAGNSSNALTLLEKVIPLYRAAPNRDEVKLLDAMNTQAAAFERERRFKDAMDLWQLVLNGYKAELGVTNRRTLTAMNNLARACGRAGKTNEAVALLNEAIPQIEVSHGPDHPLTLGMMDNLAGLRKRMGQLTHAIALFETVQTRSVAKLGSNHVDTLTSANNLAMAYREAKRLPEAIRLLESVVEWANVNPGPEDSDTLTWKHNLALAYVSGGRLTNAVPVAEALIAILKAQRGMADPKTQSEMADLALIRMRLEHFAEAEQVLDELIAEQRLRPSSSQGTFPTSLYRCSEAKLRLDKYAAAEALLRECLTLLEAIQPRPSSIFAAQSYLGWSLLAQKRYAEAETQLKQAYDGLSRVKIHPSLRAPSLRETAGRLVQVYEALGKPDEAAEWHSKAKETVAVQP